MKKLTLHLDDLAVESFDTSAVVKERGTVLGEELCSCAGSCPGQTCEATCAFTCDDPTCVESCNGTCPGQGYTCNESCGGTCWNPRCQDTNICN
jgi:hypothetical protein